MRKLLFLLLCCVDTAQSAEVAGIKFEDKLQLNADGPELALNGAGLRKKLFVKVYAAALYVPQTGGNAQTLIAAEGPRRVAIVMLRDVDARQFSEALVEGLRDNNVPPELERNRMQTEQLLAIMHAVGELKKGDGVRLDYLPESGTRIQINAESKGKPIAGAEFYRMLLRIWLGESPVDADLKQAMLGGVP